jgi:hypothetical protein
MSTSPLFRLALVFALAGLAACSLDRSPIDQTTTGYLDRVSAAVTDAAALAETPVERHATVSAARRDGGAAVFAPSSADDGGFVGWLELPQSHACAARLPAAYYLLEARVASAEANLTLRQIDGQARLDDLTVPVERIDGPAPAAPMARIALGPDSFLLGRWFKCSDGLGHCGYAVTLDAATPGCG